MTMNPLVLPEPKSLKDTGIGGDQIEQLLIKTLYTGEATGLSVADRLRLPYAILSLLVEDLRVLEDRPWREGPAGVDASALTLRATKASVDGPAH